MGDVVNLRAARKRKARAGKERAADENRARFGRSRAEKRLDRQEAETVGRTLDAHRREPTDPQS